MTKRLWRPPASAVLVGGGLTRILVPPSRLVTFGGADAVVARDLLEQAAVELVASPTDARAARIVAALLEYGALTRVPEQAPGEGPPVARRIRVLYCVTEGADAVRAGEFVNALVSDDRFEVAVALEEKALPLVNEAGLRWLFGVPVHAGLFAGESPVHSALGAWADVIAVVPASVASLQRLATGRYSDLVTATIAASSGKVVLYSDTTADALMAGRSRPVAEAIAAEGFCLVPGDPVRSDRVAVTPAELPKALEALVTGGAVGQPLSEHSSRRPGRPLRLLYGITGAIVATCSSAWLESLASASDFEIGIAATTAALRMVSVDGLCAVYANGDVSNCHRSADILVVLPAAAEFICRVADGDRSDFLSAAVAAADRVVLVPSMNSAMWSRRAVKSAISTLADAGVLIVLPGPGFRASDRHGPPGVGGIGIAPAALPALLRLIARLPRGRDAGD